MDDGHRCHSVHTCSCYSPLSVPVTFVVITQGITCVGHINLHNQRPFVFLGDLINVTNSYCWLENVFFSCDTHLPPSLPPPQCVFTPGWCFPSVRRKHLSAGGVTEIFLRVETDYKLVIPTLFVLSVIMHFNVLMSKSDCM